jgi:hypothetical protein
MFQSRPILGMVITSVKFTVPKLRVLTKLFKMYARSEALIMAIMKIPVLEHSF